MSAQPAVPPRLGLSRVRTKRRRGALREDACARSRCRGRRGGRRTVRERGRVRAARASAARASAALLTVHGALPRLRRGRRPAPLASSRPRPGAGVRRGRRASREVRVARGGRVARAVGEACERLHEGLRGDGRVARGAHRQDGVGASRHRLAHRRLERWGAPGWQVQAPPVPPASPRLLALVRHCADAGDESGCFRPVQVVGARPAISLEVGVYHACAIEQVDSLAGALGPPEGRVVCWGANAAGALMNDAFVDDVVHPAIAPAHAVAAGFSVSCPRSPRRWSAGVVWP